MLFSTLLVSVALGGSSLVSARPLNYPRAAAVTDFGSCDAPTIEFAAGLDGRKENAFEPVNESSFNHGSADNIAVITNFVCQQLQDKCKAGADAIAACAAGKSAAAGLKGGASADAFNSAFGIQTNFKALDNGGAAKNADAANADAAAAAADAAAAATPVAAAAAAAATVDFADNLQKFVGTLGAAAPPVTFDGAKFQVDGNAAFENLQNALVRSCDVQHNQCANAANAAGNSGDLNVQACGVQQIECDSLAQSEAIVEGANVSASLASVAAAATAAPAAAAAAATPAAAAAAAANVNAAAANNNNNANNADASAAPDLGKCSNPDIIFAAGLDGRKATEFSFEPANLQDFNHGTALNPNIITQFICDTFTNKCDANQAAKDLCRQAQAAVAALGSDLKTQKAADTFNSILAQGGLN